MEEKVGEKGSMFFVRFFGYVPDDDSEYDTNAYAVEGDRDAGLLVLDHVRKAQNDTAINLEEIEVIPESFDPLVGVSEAYARAAFEASGGKIFGASARVRVYTRRGQINPFTYMDVAYEERQAGTKYVVRHRVNEESILTAWADAGYPLDWRFDGADGADGADE